MSTAAKNKKAKKPTLAEYSAEISAVSSFSNYTEDQAAIVAHILLTIGTQTDNMLIRITAALAKITGIAPEHIYVPGLINRSRNDHSGILSRAFWLDCGDAYKDKSHHTMASVGAKLEKLGLACTIGNQRIYSHTEHDVRHANGSYHDVSRYDDAAVVQVDPTQKDFLAKLVNALAAQKLTEFEPESMGDSVREEMTRRARKAAEQELFGDLIAREAGRGASA